MKTVSERPTKDAREEGPKLAGEPISPKANEGVDIDEAMEEMDRKEEQERVRKEVEEIENLEARVEELEQQLRREEEGIEIPMVKEVEIPTEEEVATHNLTHANFKTWCKYCQMGAAQRKPHRRKEKYKRDSHGMIDVPDTEAAEKGIAKFSIDYAKMESKEEGKGMQVMIMVSHDDGGVWAYAVPGKGIQGDKNWVPKRMAKDIDNTGVKETKIQIKSDQEPAIVVVQEEVKEVRRARTICVNSPVGESECNGRAENAVKRAIAKVRILRAVLEDKINAKLDMKAPIATWLVRWAGEILTKYTIGKDHKTAWERRRGSKCNKPIVMFGERILYMPLKTATVHQNKAEPKMEEGIWLGINARTEEVLVGTRKGVIKCRDVHRVPEDKRCDAKLIHEMQGTTWQPVPGYKSDHIPVEISEEGIKAPRGEEDEDEVRYEVIPLEEDKDRRVEVKKKNVTDIRVTHNDVARHGATPGCSACEYIIKGKKIASGVSHSKECRERIRKCIVEEEDVKERITRAELRKSKGEHISLISKKDKEKPRHLAKLQEEVHIQMMKLVVEGMDVAEIYSPPRVAVKAREMGLRAGWSLDLTTKDEQGNKWDLSKDKMRKKAMDKIRKDKPLLVIGSPMCTDWSSLMSLNWPKMEKEDIKNRMKEARKHLRFCVEVYKHQIENGRYYLHEHPMHAKSWKEPMIKRMILKEKAIIAKIDQCQYGLKIKDREGTALAKKPTKFITNSPSIAKQLDLRCPGKGSHKEDRHASLMNGRAKKAQVYPEALCEVVCRGLKEQMEKDRRGQFHLATIRPREGAIKEKGEILANLQEKKTACSV